MFLPVNLAIYLNEDIVLVTKGESEISTEDFPRELRIAKQKRIKVNFIRFLNSRI